MMVIDNFYDNPLEVRNRVLSFTYPEETGNVTYPGRNSKEAMLPPNSDQVFSHILQEPVRGVPGSWHGVFRVALDGDKRTGEVHIDQSCSWAGIVFMTPDEYCQSGTEFYRHKKFGTDGAPLTDEEAKRVYGMDTCAEVIESLIGEGKDSRDLSKWNLVSTLPMKFNRCVLFRPWLWHRSGKDFGTSVENGRLIQLLFFEPAQNAGQVAVAPAAR